TVTRSAVVKPPPAPCPSSRPAVPSGAACSWTLAGPCGVSIVDVVIVPVSSITLCRSTVREVEQCVRFARCRVDSFDQFRTVVAHTVDSRGHRPQFQRVHEVPRRLVEHLACIRDRKSTRLNSSHVSISYAVFCLKK